MDSGQQHQEVQVDSYETELTPKEPASPTPARSPHGRRHSLIGGIAAASLVALTLGASVAAASPAPTPAATDTVVPAAADAASLAGGAVAGATVVTTGIGSAADVAKMNAAFTKYTACMREHGIDMPDPVALPGLSADGVAGGSTIASGTGAAGTVITGSVGDPSANGPSLSVWSGVVSGATQAQAPAFDPASPTFVAADAACSPILEAAGIHQAVLSGDATGSAVGSGSATIVTGGSAEMVGPVTAFTSTDPAATNAAFATYTACMREHGVAMPEHPAIALAPVPADGMPVGGMTTLVVPAQGPATDPTSPAFVAADAACFPILQAAGAVRVTVGDPIPAQPARDALPAEPQPSADPSGR